MNRTLALVLITILMLVLPALAQAPTGTITHDVMVYDGCPASLYGVNIRGRYPKGMTVRIYGEDRACGSGSLWLVGTGLYIEQYDKGGVTVEF